MSRCRHLLSWLTVAGLSLLSPALALASAAAHGQAGINWWGTDPQRPALGWLLVDFGLFLALLVVFARRPVREFVRARALRIKRAIDEAQAQKRTAEQSAAELTQRLADLDRELAGLREEIVRSGERERAQLQAEAARAAERMRRDVTLQIESETVRARAELQAETLRQSLALAEQVLRERLSAADHQRLTRQFVETFTGAQGGPQP
jgi:F-type H+-transporting ATPase subunit b